MTLEQLNQHGHEVRKPAVLTRTNRFPFLRVKKPQSEFLSRVLRDKVEQNQARQDWVEKMEIEVQMGEAEDTWDKVVRDVREEEKKLGIRVDEEDGEDVWEQEETLEIDGEGEETLDEKEFVLWQARDGAREIEVEEMVSYRPFSNITTEPSLDSPPPSLRTNSRSSTSPQTTLPPASSSWSLVSKQVAVGMSKRLALASFNAHDLSFKMLTIAEKEKELWEVERKDRKYKVKQACLRAKALLRGDVKPSTEAEARALGLALAESGGNSPMINKESRITTEPTTERRPLSMKGERGIAQDKKLEKISRAFKKAMIEPRTQETPLVLEPKKFAFQREKMEKRSHDQSPENGHQPSLTEPPVDVTRARSNEGRTRPSELREHRFIVKGRDDTPRNKPASTSSRGLDEGEDRSPERMFSMRGVRPSAISENAGADKTAETIKGGKSTSRTQRPRSIIMR